MKIVIIGGVATGMSAATRARRLDEHADIIVFEKTENVSYANCGLPYYLSGVIAKHSDLLLQTPASLNSRFNLDVRVRHEVLAINRADRRVEVRDLSTGKVFFEDYEKLVIATGATANRLNIPGEERSQTLRTVEDVEAIKAAMDKSQSNTAVVIGAGFVGIEAAENLHKAGFKVTLITTGSQILSAFDPEIVEPFQERIIESGLTVEFASKVKEITDTDVILQDGTCLPASLVVNASGVTPNTGLAKRAGLTINGGIWVNEFQQTSDENIYAGGDAALKRNELTGMDALIPLANLANRHGRAIADAIVGLAVKPSSSIGTAVIGAFGMTLAVTGLTEKTANNYSVIHLHPSSHAAYYPGAKPISLKVLFDAGSGLLLGAQAVGEDGVDKRIDVIATAIKGKLTISDLMDLELSYAPQFGSAKDAINQAGYVGNNVASGTTGVIQWHEIEDYLSQGWTLVDVRSSNEHQSGSIPGGTNIPVDELRNNIAKLAGKKVLVHCQVGQRGHTAAQILKGYGIEVLNVDGGYKTWHSGINARKRTEV